MVRGVLLYFPFTDGVETTPLRSKFSLGAVETDLDDYYGAPVISSTRNGSSSAARSSYSQAPVASQHGTTDAPIIIDLDSTTENGEDVFSILWANRLVPDTTVQRLPFFPYTGEKIAADVSEYWKVRIKGFLFLDWKFEYISNNKLQIQVNPNFSKFLNSKEVRLATSYLPRDIKHNMLS